MNTCILLHINPLINKLPIIRIQYHSLYITFKVTILSSNDTINKKIKVLCFIPDVVMLVFLGVAAGVGEVLAETVEPDLANDEVPLGVTLRAEAAVEVGPEVMLLAGVPLVLGDSDPAVEDRRDERSSMS